MGSGNLDQDDPDAVGILDLHLDQTPRLDYRIPHDRESSHGLPDPRSPRGRIYPLACLVAVVLRAFTGAGNDRLTAVEQWIRRTWPGCASGRIRWQAGTG